MRSLVQIFALLLLGFHASTQTIVSTEPQKKDVLIEELTGILCPNCPEGAYVIHELMKDYPIKSQANEKDPTLHQMLVRLEYPLVTGIIRRFDDITLDEREDALTKEVKANSKFTKTDDLFFSGETYEVH